MSFYPSVPPFFFLMLSSTGEDTRVKRRWITGSNSILPWQRKDHCHVSPMRECLLNDLTTFLYNNDSVITDKFRDHPFFFKPSHSFMTDHHDLAEPHEGLLCTLISFITSHNRTRGGLFCVLLLWLLLTLSFGKGLSTPLFSLSLYLFTFSILLSLFLILVFVYIPTY